MNEIKWIEETRIKLEKGGCINTPQEVLQYLKEINKEMAADNIERFD